MRIRSPRHGRPYKQADLTGAEFRGSSLGGADNDRVEVAANLPEVVAVRDGKAPSGPAPVFFPTAWSDFLVGVRDGDL